MPTSIFSAFATLSLAQTIVQTAAAALFYVGAMVAMKLWTEAPSALILVAIVGAMAVGAGFEISALRGERLGMIYVTILGVEVIMIALVAVLVMGEGFSPRECVGCVLVVLGTALAWS